MSYLDRNTLQYYFGRFSDLRLLMNLSLWKFYTRICLFNSCHGGVGRGWHLYFEPWKSRQHSQERQGDSCFILQWRWVCCLALRTCHCIWRYQETTKGDREGKLLLKKKSENSRREGKKKVDLPASGSSSNIFAPGWMAQQMVKYLKYVLKIISKFKRFGKLFYLFKWNTVSFFGSLVTSYWDFWFLLGMYVMRCSSALQRH